MMYGLGYSKLLYQGRKNCESRCQSGFLSCKDKVNTTKNKNEDFIEDHINITEPTSEEAEKMICHPKNSKSPGENDVPPELIKYGGGSTQIGRVEKYTHV